MFYKHLLTLSVIAISASAVHSQELARVAKSQGVVEISSTGTTWTASRDGSAIMAGQTVRTGKRSKADIRFVDGSIIRLGQLSNVVIAGPRNVHLSKGQLLLSWLSPGRVLTGYATAEIKGTVATVTVDESHTNVSLYEGNLDVLTHAARKTIPVGNALDAFPDGSLSLLRAAVPLQFAAQGAPLELLSAPQQAPYVGSGLNKIDRGMPERVAVDEPVKREGKGKGKGQGGGKGKPVDPLDDGGGKGNGNGNNGNNGNGNNGNNGNGNGNNGNGNGNGNNGNGNGNNGNGNGNNGNGNGNNGNGNNGEDDFRATFARLASSGLQSGSASGPVPSGGTDPTQKVMLAQVGLPGEAVSGANGAAVQTQNAVSDVTSVGLSDAALRRLEELKVARGKISGWDARAIGVLGDEGSRAYGARIHGYYAQGNWMLDGAIQPLRIRAGGQRLDMSAISDLSLTYRDNRMEAQAGRQRFLSGPTQATLYGSLVRQGGREIMDAVRVAPTIGNQQSLEVAYLVDAYPRNLPYRVSGLQRGLYARYATWKKANLGVNILKLQSRPVPTRLGASLDFALPLAGGKVDLYGEVGRDIYARRLTTVGMNFPQFYEKTGYDLYLELANLGSSSLAGRPPTELAARLYRKVNDNVDVVSSLSRFSDGETSFSVAISAGTAIR